MTFLVVQGDAQQIPLADESVSLVVTSPPYYGLREYGTGKWEGGDAACEHTIGNQVQDNKAPGAITSGVRPGCDASTCKKCGALRVDKQIGLEPTIESYVTNLVIVFREVKRVLHRSGVLFLNLGDSYTSTGRSDQHKSPKGTNGQEVKGSRREVIWGTERHDNFSWTLPGGLKPKDLCMIPARVALALQADGWTLRSMIPWVKRNPMPESVDSRPSSAVEYIFMLTKSEKYYYDSEGIRKLQVDPARGAKPKTEKYGGHRVPGREKEQFVTGWRKTEESWNPAGRARRNSDWFFESWQGLLGDEAGDPLALVVNPAGYSGAHFATFPPKLVEPLIKAGSSERGVCSACRAPWVRNTQKFPNNDGYPNGPGGRHKEYEVHHGSLRTVARWDTQTLGWSSSCSCNAPIQPALIVDIFGGAGTVGLMSHKLGRNSISLDLSFDYSQMARDRITADAPLLHWGETAPVAVHPPRVETQSDFWGKE